MRSGANHDGVSGRSGRRPKGTYGSGGMNFSPSENGQELRDTGLKAVGEVPFGTHFCIFYETKKDLLDILVPYFRAGVESNELCVCYGGSYEFHTIPEAKRRLSRELPELDQLLKDRKIEILARKDWFGDAGKKSLPK